MTDNRITILGAGLCGALLAIILARRGIAVTMLERLPDPRVKRVASNRSINLALAARGIRGLRYAGVLDIVEPLLIPMRGRRIHSIDGNTELHMYGQRPTEVIYSVSRAELNCVLVDAADQVPGVEIQFEHQAMDYDPESAILQMLDLQKDCNYSLPSSPLIAADGAGSVVRRAYRGDTVIGSSEELLQHRYKELTVPGRSDGTHQMDRNALHIWPRGGFMLIALPNTDGGFTLTLFLPADGEPSFSSLDSDEKVQSFFAQHFPDVAPLITNLSGNWARNPAGILGTVRSEHWHDRGDVLLIGDAAHAVVPFHGQGMNLTFEDCVVLDEVLAAQSDPSAPDWEAVFRMFENRQLENANAIADMALENYIEMRDTVREPKHRLRQELAFALERSLPQRFIPRYSMVMFHDEIPYRTAKARGELQRALLQELTRDAESMDDIDLDEAVKIARRTLRRL